MDIEKLEKQLRFIKEIDKMKQVYRQTFLMDASRRENDAEHSWHLALCAILLSEYSDNQPLDMYKVLKMCLVHDLVEIYAGDTFAYDEKGHEDKDLREKIAADKIYGILPEEQGKDLREAWEEYERCESPEAKYVMGLDTLQPLLHNLETKGILWHLNGVNSTKVKKRKQRISNMSRELGSYLDNILDQAVEMGYLKK